MNKKQLYTAPAAGLLVVRFEGNILTSNYGDSGHAGGDVIPGNEYNL